MPFGFRRRRSEDGSGSEASSGSRVLLPVLRSSEIEGTFLALLASGPVCGSLRVTLARREIRPDGRHRFHWLLAREVPDVYSFDALVTEALGNLRDGLRVDVHDTEAGRMLGMRRVDGAPAAAAVMLDDLWSVAGEHLGGSGDLLIGIPSDFELMICRESDGIASVLLAAVDGAAASTESEWTIPTVVRLGPGGLSPA